MNVSFSQSNCPAVGPVPVSVSDFASSARSHLTAAQRWTALPPVRHSPSAPPTSEGLAGRNRNIGSPSDRRAGGGIARRFAGVGAALRLGATFLGGVALAAGFANRAAAAEAYFYFSDNDSISRIEASGSLDLKTGSSDVAGSGENEVIIAKVNDIGFKTDFKIPKSSSSVSGLRFENRINNSFHPGLDSWQGSANNDLAGNSYSSNFFVELEHTALRGMVITVEGTSRSGNVVNFANGVATWNGTLASTLGDNDFHMTVAWGESSSNRDQSVVFSTRDPKPGKPTELTAATGDTEVTLSWKDPSDSTITKYQYRQKAATDTEYGAWQDIDSSSATTISHTVTELTNGTEYAFEVRAVNVHGDGQGSAEVAATPEPLPSAAMLEASASPGLRQVALSWTFSGTGATIANWQYQHREGDAAFGDEWTDVPDSDAATRTYTVPGLTADVEHGFRVRAYGLAGGGAVSNEASATPVAGPPAAVLSASPGTLQVILTWTYSGAAASKWQYQQREGDAAFGDEWTDVPGSDAATRTYTVPGLTAGVEHGFRIRAYGLAGGGAVSNEASATPVAGPSVETERRVVKRTLAAVAQTALTGAADTIGQRFDAAPGSRSLTLAGLQVGGAGGLLEPGTAAGGSRASVASDSGMAGGGERDGIGHVVGNLRSAFDGGALLRDSAFTLSLAGEAPAAGASDWTVWGRGDWRNFEGRKSGDNWEGEQRTGWLGVDGRLNGRLMAGVAVSRGVSEVDYRLDPFEGRLETSLTALWPYLQTKTNGGGSVQLVLGAGKGEAEHRQFDGEVERADLSMLAGSVIGRLPVARRGGFNLSAVGSASLSQIETDGSSSTSIGGLTAKAWRLRGGVEAEHDGFALSSDLEGRIRPRGALALRQDGGDGVTGAGAEVSGGVRLSAPGARFGLDASGHWLALHSEEGMREWGASVEARISPETDGHGLSLAFGPAWGRQRNGALASEGLFEQERGDGEPQRLSFTARAGYGFAAAGGQLTPAAELAFGGESRSRHYRTGLGFARNGIDASLTAEHRQGGEPDTRIELDLRLQY